MFSDDIIAPYRCQGFTGNNINTDTQCTLVQVGSATRHARREAGHTHYRDTKKHDDTNVRNSLVADGIEQRVSLNSVLYQCFVWLPTQAVNTAQDIGYMMVELLLTNEQAVYFSVHLPQTIGNDQDSVSTASTGRLDHKIPILPQHITQVTHLMFCLHHAIQFRNSYTSPLSKLLSTQLVINQGIQSARVIP